MLRPTLLRIVETAGAQHAFVEDCPCGDCEDFFAFGRDDAGTVWLALSTDGAPFVLWRKGDRPLSLLIVSAELQRVLSTVTRTLEESDPLGGMSPITLSPLPPEKAIEVMKRVEGPLVERSPEEAEKVATRREAQRARAKACWQEKRAAGFLPMNAKPITFRGETMLASEWARRLGITPAAIYARLARWPIERALTMPANVARQRSAGRKVHV